MSFRALLFYTRVRGNKNAVDMVYGISCVGGGGHLDRPLYYMTTCTTTACICVKIAPIKPDKHHYRMRVGLTFINW